MTFGLLYFPLHLASFEKPSTLKGENLFPFIAESFSEGTQNSFNKVVSLESVSIPLKFQLCVTFTIQLKNSLLFVD